MKELLSLTKKLYEKVFEQTGLLTFSHENVQQVIAVCLHGTIIENSWACLTLYNKKLFSAVPVLVRNILEAYVDLRNICQHPEYCNNMNASYLKEFSRVINEAIKSNKMNPYLIDLAGYEGVEKLYEQIQNDLRMIKKEGFHVLSIRDKFDHAGLLDLYLSVYPQLCQQSHNNLNSLERRHIEKNEAGVEVSYFQKKNKNEFLFHIDTIAGIIVGSLRSLTALLKIENNIDMDSVEKSLKALRSTYVEIAK